jgi:hypothetical protein
VTTTSGSESPAFSKAVSSSAFGDGYSSSLGTTLTFTGTPQANSSLSGVHLSLISEIFNQIDRKSIHYFFFRFFILLILLVFFFLQRRPQWKVVRGGGGEGAAQAQ